MPFKALLGVSLAGGIMTYLVFSMFQENNKSQELMNQQLKIEAIKFDEKMDRIEGLEIKRTSSIENNKEDKAGLKSRTDSVVAFLDSSANEAREKLIAEKKKEAKLIREKKIAQERLEKQLKEMDETISTLDVPENNTLSLDNI